MIICRMAINAQTLQGWLPQATICEEKIMTLHRFRHLRLSATTAMLTVLDRVEGL